MGGTRKSTIRVVISEFVYFLTCFPRQDDDDEEDALGRRRIAKVLVKKFKVCDLFGWYYVASSSVVALVTLTLKLSLEAIHLSGKLSTQEGGEN